MRLYWWSYSQKIWLLCDSAQLKGKKKNLFCVHITLIILLISFLYFFSSFSFISVHLSLSFSLLFHFLVPFFSQNFLSFFSNFSLKFFSFSSQIFSLSSQFFLCCVRVSSFAVWVWVWMWWVMPWVWVWWVIGFGSCRGYGLVPWRSCVLLWGLCGGSSVSWSFHGCGGSSVLGHAVGFIFVVVGWFSWVVVGWFW